MAFSILVPNQELRRESAEPEATTEDELLKDCKEEGERTMVEELVAGKDDEDDEEGEEDEDEAEVVSLRGLRHSQSLPATPRSSESNLCIVLVFTLVDTESISSRGQCKVKPRVSGFS